MERNCNCLGRNTKHFFGATLSFDVVYLLLSALCWIDPYWMLLLPVCLPLFDCINIAWQFCIPKDPTKGHTKKSPPLLRPSFEPRNRAPFAGRRHLPKQICRSARWFQWDAWFRFEGASQMPTRGVRQGERFSHQIGPPGDLASVWIVWMVPAANPWKRKKKLPNPWALGHFFFAGTDDQYVRKPVVRGDGKE